MKKMQVSRENKTLLWTMAAQDKSNRYVEKVESAAVGRLRHSRLRHGRARASLHGCLQARASLPSQAVGLALIRCPSICLRAAQFPGGGPPLPASVGTQASARSARLLARPPTRPPWDAHNPQTASTTK